MSKSLFLLKLREDYSQDSSYSYSHQIASGMYNSAKFVVDDLNANGREAEVAIIHDANAIDGAVLGYNASHIFIEGLWVPPAKFQELMALPRHAGRIWHVRIHSEIPFLASEGIAMGWIAEYLALGVHVVPNAPRAHNQINWQAQNLVAPAIGDVLYLPNCYPYADFEPIVPYVESPTIHIACFGAFRPMKNHLNQAFLALQIAEKLGKTLVFHVNSRVDAGGGGPSKNVLELFASVGATIVEHGWEDRETFLASMASIDLLLQVSMSETFNIVAADAVLVGKPILVSNEIPWVYPLTGDPQSVEDCLKRLDFIWGNKSFFITRNRVRLTRYAQESTRRWLDYIPV